MAHPTPYAIELIQNYINTDVSGGFSQNNIYLCDRLNSPGYTDNPISQEYVFTNFQTPDVFSLISGSSVRNVLDSPGTAVSLLPLLNEIPHTPTNIYFLNTWAQAFVAAEVITPLEYVSITGVINKMVLDPTWPSSISWSQSVLNRNIDIDDIQACR